MQEYAIRQHSPPMMTIPSNGNNNNNMHLLAHIPSVLRQNLTLIGIFYIIAGLLSIGLDVGQLFQGFPFSLYTGFITGFFSIFCGILMLVLCREQVYVLTSIFAVVLWQLLILVASFIVHIFGFLIDDCYRYYRGCQSGTILGIVSILTVVVSLICTIFAMVFIVRGKRPPNQLVQFSTLMVTNPST